MENAIVLIVLLAVLLVGVFVRSSREARATRILREWAAQNGYQLTAFDHRYARRGPFASERSKAQHVMRIHVQDEGNSDRSGWVRIAIDSVQQGNDPVTVIWD